MNILYLCSDSGIPVLGRKGASVHVRSLVSAFTAAGHSVVLATPVLSTSPWELPAAIEAQVLHVPANEMTVAAVDAVRSYNQAVGTTNTLPSELRRILYNQQLGAKLIRHFEKKPPDFIYERATLYGTAGVTVARTLGVPLVLELNAPLSVEQSTYRGSQLRELGCEAERHTLTAANLVLTVSEPLHQYVIAQGVDPTRAKVIPNAIDPHLFAPGQPSQAVRNRWHIGSGPVIGFVGGLRPWHGVRTLPALLEQLARRHPAVQMLIVGDGPLSDELSCAFRARGVGDRVVFTGNIAHQDVPDVMRLFDIAVAPYDDTDHLFYFSPLKLFEYMGCGLPVVAGALGQIAETICHNDTGLLYSPGDVHALADACERLLNDSHLRRRIGDAAAVAVRRQFTWAQNAERVIQLAQALMAPQETFA